MSGLAPKLARGRKIGAVALLAMALTYPVAGPFLGGSTPPLSCSIDAATPVVATASRDLDPQQAQLTWSRGPRFGPYEVTAQDTATNRAVAISKGGSNYEPAWSPDGLRLAFTRDISASQRTLWISDGDGSNARQLTSREASGPAWSPDGLRIAYFDGEDGLLYTVSASGGRPTLASGPDALLQLGPRGRALGPGDWAVSPWGRPSWSPDGSQLVFAILDPRTPAADLALLNIRTGTITRLTDTRDCDESDPAWSADGGRILFSGHPWSDDPGTQTGPTDLYTITPDGSHRTQLSQNSLEESNAAWSPDGRTIAFSAGTEDHGDIYLINADGSGLTQITSATSEEFNQGPAWRP